MRYLFYFSLVYLSNILLPSVVVVMVNWLIIFVRAYGYGQVQSYQSPPVAPAPVAPVPAQPYSQYYQQPQTPVRNTLKRLTLYN